MENIPCKFLEHWTENQEIIEELKEDLRVGSILVANLTDQCRELEAQLAKVRDRTELHEWGSPKGLPKGWRGRIMKGSEADQKGYYRGVDWATNVAEETLTKVFKAHETEIEQAKERGLEAGKLLGAKEEGERICEELRLIYNSGDALKMAQDFENWFIPFKLRRVNK